METIVRLALTPDPDAKLTPLELLEDFADASPGWHFLEEESAHYADEKNVPACLLRRRREGAIRNVDFAFAAPDPGDPHAIELIVLDAPDPAHQLDRSGRNQVVDTFLRQLRTYLDNRPHQASLQVVKEDVDPSIDT
jgi:hypothetical protein